MDSQRKSAAMARDAAETLAISALAFLAQDRARLARFLSVTGLSPERLMQEAATPATLTAVLEYLLADESLLLTFAASAGIPAADVEPARSVLSGELQTRKRP
jgi:hypothetical protein